jgi:transglutaminase-like putative cysteine protease
MACRRRPKTMSLRAPQLLLLALVCLALPASARSGERVLRFQQLSLAMGGHEVGVTEAKDFETDEGFRFERHTKLHIKRGDAQLEIETRSSARTDKELRPIAYRFERKDASGTLVSEGEVKGGTLNLSSTQAGATVKNAVAVPAGMTFSSALDFLVRRELAAAAAGKTNLSRPVLVEEMGAVSPMKVSVKRSASGYTITTELAGLVTTETVDGKGNTLLSSTPSLNAFAYPLGAAPPASVKAGEVDMYARSVWRAPQLASDVRRVRYRVHAPDARRFEVPEDHRQQVVARTDTWLEVEVRAGPSRVGGLTAEERKSLLAATPYEPVGDPRLLQAAKKATVGATSTSEKIRRLVAFVYEHVEEKGLDRGYAPALATLDSGAGDCTEHSVLLSALLRSLGIPTRLVDGVVVTGGRAGYHEWVEVHVEGQGFVPADPTFGVFPAGPQRLKLAEGSSAPEGLLHLGVAAGRLLQKGVRIEVVDATPPPR